MFKKRNYGNTELYLGKGTKFFGNLIVEGSAIVEGEIVGENLELKGELILGKTGKIKVKSIRGLSIVSQGEIETERISCERAEFRTGAKFRGDVECKILVVEEGAKVNGRIFQDVQAPDKG